VYLFRTSTGDLLQTYTNPEPSIGNVQFGFNINEYRSRMIAIDNGRVLIGAPEAGSAEGAPDGKAYLFGTGSNEVLQIIDNPYPDPSPVPNMHGFGFTVDLDGDAALISTVAGGAVHLYQISTGTLRHTFLKPEDVDGIVATAIKACSVFIGGTLSPNYSEGQGKVYVYDAETYALKQVSTAQREYFGRHLAASDNGVLVASDPALQVDDQGVLYVYRQENLPAACTSAAPSDTPSSSPSVNPTGLPSLALSIFPSHLPTATIPSSAPFDEPLQESEIPSAEPSITSPSLSPTSARFDEALEDPDNPTTQPSPGPSQTPTEDPASDEPSCNGFFLFCIVGSVFGFFGSIISAILSVFGF